MNMGLLRERMLRYGDTGRTLAPAIGISPQRLSNKMNGYRGADFTRQEIQGIARRYRLTESEIGEIFFADQVS